MVVVVPVVVVVAACVVVVAGWVVVVVPVVVGSVVLVGSVVAVGSVVVAPVEVVVSDVVDVVVAVVVVGSAVVGVVSRVVVGAVLVVDVVAMEASVGVVHTCSSANPMFVVVGETPVTVNRRLLTFRDVNATLVAVPFALRVPTVTELPSENVIVPEVMLSAVLGRSKRTTRSIDCEVPQLTLR